MSGISAHNTDNGIQNLTSDDCVLIQKLYKKTTISSAPQVAIDTLHKFPSQPSLPLPPYSASTTLTIATTYDALSHKYSPFGFVSFCGCAKTLNQNIKQTTPKPPH